jgi:hypothetical protein
MKTMLLKFLKVDFFQGFIPKLRDNSFHGYTDEKIDDIPIFNPITRFSDGYYMKIFNV